MGHTRRTPAQRLAYAEALAGRAREAMRRHDAHRKIELGGVVVAAGADNLDPAALCGLILEALDQASPQRLQEARARGHAHFEHRSSKGRPRAAE